MTIDSHFSVSKKAFFFTALFLLIFLFIDGLSLCLIKYYLIPNRKIQVVDIYEMNKRINEFAKKGAASNFDSLLGWTMKPLASEQNEEWSYRIDERGARLNNKNKNRTRISTYGDSFTFSDQVDDDETWQYYLSDLTKSNVINFGVGGYGTDQALLRIEQEFDNNPTEIVMLGILTENLARNVNRYRAVYQWPDNWGPTKPMFFASGGGGYVLLENPIRRLEDTYKLKNDRFVSDICEGYDFWFTNYQSITKFKFPFILSLVKSIFTEKKRGTSHSEIIINERAIETTQYIVKRFLDFAKQKKFTPVVVLFPTIYDMDDYYKKNNHNFNRLKNAIAKLEGLVIIDIFDVFRDQLVLNNILVEHLYMNKQHISPQGNFIIATAINDLYYKGILSGTEFDK